MIKWVLQVLFQVVDVKMNTHMGLPEFLITLNGLQQKLVLTLNKNDYSSLSFLIFCFYTMYFSELLFNNSIPEWTNFLKKPLR